MWESGSKTVFVVVNFVPIAAVVVAFAVAAMKTVEFADALYVPAVVARPPLPHPPHCPENVGHLHSFQRTFLLPAVSSAPTVGAAVWAALSQMLRSLVVVVVAAELS